MAKRRLKFAKELRVRNSLEFGEIMKRGGFAADGQLVVNARLAAKPAKSGQYRGRLGITIPKKTGNAVMRNLWKRLIREAYRVQQHEMPVGFDFVVKPKRGAQPDFQAIRMSLISLAERASRAKRSSGNRGGNRDGKVGGKPA